jgi:hypothetical protein
MFLSFTQRTHYLHPQDEVSMLSAELLEAVIHRLRLVRKAYNKDMRRFNLPEVCAPFACPGTAQHTSDP